MIILLLIVIALIFWQQTVAVIRWCFFTGASVAFWCFVVSLQVVFWFFNGTVKIPEGAEIKEEEPPLDPEEARKAFYRKDW